MKLSRRKLRTLIESVIAESTASGRKAFHKSEVSKVTNKDKYEAEKIMNQIKGADWNAGYEVDLIMQDERATGLAALTPIGQATNKLLPGAETKYGVQITGFSSQDEADDFSEIVRRKIDRRAVSIKDEKTVIVDPAKSASSHVSFSLGASGLDYKP